MWQVIRVCTRFDDKINLEKKNDIFGNSDPSKYRIDHPNVNDIFLQNLYSEITTRSS